MDVSTHRLTRVKSPLEVQLGSKKFTQLMNCIQCLHYGGE